MGKIINGGLYAGVEFNGSSESYFNFSQKIYTHVLPEANLQRREGEDIENFHYQPGVESSCRVEIVSITYYIPVTNSTTERSVS